MRWSHKCKITPTVHVFVAWFCIILFYFNCMLLFYLYHNVHVHVHSFQYSFKYIVMCMEISLFHRSYHFLLFISWYSTKVVHCYYTSYLKKRVKIPTFENWFFLTYLHEKYFPTLRKVQTWDMDFRKAVSLSGCSW